MVAEIAAGAPSRRRALKEVNAAVGEMDQVTQRNAAMVEETTAASHICSRRPAISAGVHPTLSGFGRRDVGAGGARAPRRLRADAGRHSIARRPARRAADRRRGGVFGEAPVADGRSRLQTFSKLFPNFLQIFGGFLQAFPNFCLAVLGDFRGLEGRKFGERPFRFSPNFWLSPRTQFFAQGVEATPTLGADAGSRFSLVK